MPDIIRITLFKIEDASAITEAIAKYSTLAQDATKDGKPYIKFASASKTHDDARNNGYTMLARTVYADMAGLKYYDDECKAHGEIKALLKGKVVGGPPLVVLFDA